MKILVTGANGFVGRVCVAVMLARGYDVEALDLMDQGYFIGSGIKRFHTHDITTPFIIIENFDAVVHLAAHNFTHVGDTEMSQHMRVNVDGTANVLSGVRTKRFIFLSTAKVYRKQKGVITEESELAPQQPYEITKRLAEELCIRVKNNQGLVILRSVNVFGFGQPEKAVIPIFFARAMSGEPIRVFGPRGSWMQFVHVDDLVRALEMAVMIPSVNGIFNVASDDVVRLEDLALMIKKICRSSSEVYFVDNRFESKVEVSYDKIKGVFGWQPSVILEEALHRYLKCYAQ